jgi:lysophospholipase L1-like esterase
LTPTRVAIIGNSVALYVRPRTPSGRAYGHRLRELLAARTHGSVEVELHAENSLTAADLVRDYEDRIIALAADVTVLHVGIVEATPRILPQRWRQAFIRGQTPLQRVWVRAESAVRRPLVGLLGGVTAMGPEHFRRALARAIGAGQDGQGRVVCLGIPLPTARVEAEVPGATEQVRRFDAVVREVCRKTGAAYLDVESIMTALGRDRGMPDGIHFSEAGHDAVAAELARVIAETNAGARNALGASNAELNLDRRTNGGLVGAAASSFAAPLVVFSAVWIPAVRLVRALRGRE